MLIIRDTFLHVENRTKEATAKVVLIIYIFLNKRVGTCTVKQQRIHKEIFERIRNFVILHTFTLLQCNYRFQQFTHALTMNYSIVFCNSCPIVQAIESTMDKFESRILAILARHIIMYLFTLWYQKFLNTLKINPFGTKNH